MILRKCKKAKGNCEKCNNKKICYKKDLISLSKELKKNDKSINRNNSNNN